MHIPSYSRHHLYCGVQPLRGAASHRGQRRSSCHLPARDWGKGSSDPTFYLLSFPYVFLTKMHFSFSRTRVSHSAVVNTMFTAHFRATSLSLTTWRAWKSRKRLIRSAGYHKRMLHNFCCPQMVSRALGHCVVLLLAQSHRSISSP